MPGRSTVPRGCVVCGAEHPDLHDAPTHAAHEERLRLEAVAAARRELEEAGVPVLEENEQRALWGDR